MECRQGKTHKTQENLIQVLQKYSRKQFETSSFDQTFDHVASNILLCTDFKEENFNSGTESSRRTSHRVNSDSSLANKALVACDNENAGTKPFHFAQENENRIFTRLSRSTTSATQHTDFVDVSLVRGSLS